MSKKEIAKIKLTLTTNCNSNCGYCFVEKSNERMSFEVAKKSVNLLLESPGKDKLLSLYGGEPFLEFPLIEEVVTYARKREVKLKKRLIISICSNLLWLDDKKIAFLKKHKLKVTVSIVGKSADHNKFRSATGREKPYAKVIKNLIWLASELPSSDIGISFVVLPRLSSKMVEYFKHIISLGLSNNINFEIIQEFEKWREIDRKNFIGGFHEILLMTLEMIARNNFIFINPISWELGRRKLTEAQSTSCQVRHNLEVYPSGDMAFSPFLLNCEGELKSHFLIGNAKTGLNRKFGSCIFNLSSDKCKRCENDYYAKYQRTDDAYLIVDAYTKMSLEAAKKIAKKAKVNKYFRDYVSYAKKNLCF